MTLYILYKHCSNILYKSKTCIIFKCLMYYPYKIHTIEIININGPIARFKLKKKKKKS